MYTWLSYGENSGTEKVINLTYIADKEKLDSYFLRREFSFTLRGDIYTRFKAFPTLEAFSSTVKKDNPHKIDIGAVYTISVKMKKF